ncbi:ribonuclease Y [Helicobacter cetorum]|uniref:Ribonuclease Y n=1 Tax=Helicobacter cetorum (strain ATCC BAA-540 / CCUG 52418 / MIT 99-5656) TaxID=1163745 RepID=I0ETW2_HELCM|nr:ribonuclease Y [Helicobacter cetorum]AFI06381.1 phosphodiesterase [Helicobacter cetorum MIT 99-5656]
MKRIYHAKGQALLKSASAKAKLMEFQAKSFVEAEEMRMKNLEFQLKQQYENKNLQLKTNFDKKEAHLRHVEAQYKEFARDERRYLEKEKKELEKERKLLEKEKEKTKEQVRACKETQAKALDVMLNYMAYTKDEVKDMVLEQLEEELEAQKSALIRRYEKEAKEESKKKSYEILAEATARFAGNYATENLISRIVLPCTEYIGRVIGKDGKNIETFKKISGVDIEFSEDYSEVYLSSFNIYRREVASETLKILVEDGRIQPHRIEEVYERVSHNMEKNLLSEGHGVVLELELGAMEDELKILLGKMRYRSSFGQNALQHSKEVAFLAGLIAEQLGGDKKLARRAGILHDIGKALTQELGRDHVSLGVEVCKRNKEDPVVINAIYAHHGHEEIMSIECASVCAADALSAGRPGARRKSDEEYAKRMQILEEIALEFEGVEKAYAMESGRELRVIVKSSQVRDNQVPIIARKIAKKIEENTQYVGEVGVQVVRENRFKTTATLRQ